MEEMVTRIQSVINTLEGLDIRSTYENMDRLLGCLQVLAKIRDDLKEKEAKADGNPDA